MKVIVIGNGAREHAILWKLAQSARHPELLAAPGNAGTAKIATNIAVRLDQVESLLQVAHEHSADLTVVATDAAVAAVIVDRFRTEGLKIFGPSQSMARIGSSKVFAKHLMAQVGIPCAYFRVFSAYNDARNYVLQHGAPVVVKTDGPAPGRKVVAQTKGEALDTLDSILKRRSFGTSGDQVIIEDVLEGEELSIFAFTDGKTVAPLVAAHGYKYLLDGDLGPPTAGMGAYSSPEIWNDTLECQIGDSIILPTIRALGQIGTRFAGILHVRVILTKNGPYVLDFDSNLKDPEAQVILPRLKGDLLEVIEAVLSGSLDQLDFGWSDKAYVGVVMVSGDYPERYGTGFSVSGLGAMDQDSSVFHYTTTFRDGQVLTVPVSGLAAVDQDILVFHYATNFRDGQVLTGGGRVLTQVGVSR